MREYKYNREKIKICLKNGKTYIFVTEPESHMETSWLYNTSQSDITVWNTSGKRYIFALHNVSYYDVPIDFKTLKFGVEDDSLTVKETEKDVFEINHFIKVNKE